MGLWSIIYWSLVSCSEFVAVNAVLKLATTVCAWALRSPPSLIEGSKSHQPCLHLGINTKGKVASRLDMVNLILSCDFMNNLSL